MGYLLLGWKNDPPPGRSLPTFDPTSGGKLTYSIVKVERPPAAGLWYAAA